MRVLLLQLEFPTWKTARPWTYGGSFAIADGLAANGVECVTVPIMPDRSSSSPSSWLHHARRFLAGQRFDQVWIWLVHASLDPQILDWITTLAPVRVGFFMESLRYEEEDYRWAPELRSRHVAFQRQLQFLTHALLVDERDVEEVSAQGKIPALWCPGLVPQRFIATPSHPPRHDRAVFHGSLYGARGHWVDHPSLRQHMVFAKAPTHDTPTQQAFDRLQATAQQRLLQGPPVTSADLDRYVREWHRIRETEFREWLEGLTDWPAIVNLPGLTRCFGGRVYEAMAVGRPVISWRIPNRPKANALFADGEDILLFSPDHPESLARQIDHVLKDPAFSRAIAMRAQRKLLAYHTAEHRARHILRWIEKGTQPDYGLPSAPASELIQIRSAASVTPPQTESTTVFVLTIGDPAFEACQRALQQQTGTTFRTVVVKNVCPFSAAAQQMITSCETEFFIQLDEDMILHPDAVATMEQALRQAPESVGMICFHLYDEDRDLDIQGVKIYRAASMKALGFQDVKASEMDLLEQMGRNGIQWILHPDVKGRHGTLYTPETIYRRYKTMYEKDIRQWNTLTSDIRRKADRFRQTGDPLQLFALLGAAHGIVAAPHAPDREKDARQYGLKELDVFRRLLLADPDRTQPYDAARTAVPLSNPPIPFEQVAWKATGNRLGNIPRPHDRPAAAEKTAVKRVLIVTPYFWPSVGGVERVVELLGVELVRAGYEVNVAAHPHPARKDHTFRGLTIISLADHDQFQKEAPVAGLQVEALLASGRYNTCLLIGAPTNGLFYGALSPRRPQHTRLIVQPTMNQEVYQDLLRHAFIRPMFVQLAKQADAVITLSETGSDARFLKEQQLPAVYIPNGTVRQSSGTGFREKYRIGADTFLILHVANLYPVKNHPGLLKALAPLPPGAALVIIGHSTHEAAYVQKVKQTLRDYPDVVHLEDLTPEDVGAAMEAADLLVLCSHTEASPLCILEAMSHRLPWLATPECGTVTELAGGIVAPLKDFRRHVIELMKARDVAQALGDAGQAHWKACHQWPDVFRGWLDLIETGQLHRSYRMPDAVRQDMAMLSARLTSREQADTRRQEPAHSSLPSAGAPAHRPRQTTGQAAHTMTLGGPMDSDNYYVNMFVNSPAWSRPEPNTDEAARWSKIASFLEHVLRQVRSDRPQAQLRMVEVGCGRGWLCQLASDYGTVEGVEPVGGVIAHAKKLFPHIRFETGTAETILARPDFAPYDVVLCSEVIEHVPHAQKGQFLEQLKQLLVPGGFLILSTPRGEMWEQWQTISPPCQPIEDWVTEAQLEAHFTEQGFSPQGLERIYVELPTLRYIPAPTPRDLATMNLVPIYQVWLSQRLPVEPGRLMRLINRVPKVSVIVPTFNRPERLKATLESVLQQTLQDFEIIVVNDGATPVEAFLRDLDPAQRISVVIHDRNRGLASSRNTGLRQAKGKYVCYLDDDDRFLPDHLETLVQALETRDCKVAYTDAWRVHEKQADDRCVETGRDQPYSEDFNPHQLLIGNYIPVLCVMHERSCIDEVGGFDESLYVHEDWDLWIRMATRYPFLHIAKTTAEFTWRTDGSTMTYQSQDAFLRTAEIIYRKYAPYAALHPSLQENQRTRLKDLRSKRQPKKPFACSIIIPVWNKVELTRQCLEALGPATEDVTFEVIIVDNHSTDDTPQLLAALGGDVRVITNQDNLGFAKACNQGAAVATGDYLVFLNNDTIPLKGWLSPLVNEVRTHADVAVVGSKLLFENRTVQHAGVAIDRLNLTPYHIYRGFSQDHPAVNKRLEMNAVTAACMLIRRSVFQEVGGFDEEFVNGFEDIDLCFKVREKGHRIVYQPQSVLFHLESQTPGRKQHDTQNALRLHRKWSGHWWLVDDDSRYFEDGYRVAITKNGGQDRFEIHLLDTPQERQAWSLVAQLQRAAGRRDDATVVELLSRHAAWPADRTILEWGHHVAGHLGRPDLAAAFTERVRALTDPGAGVLDEIRTTLMNGQLPVAASRIDAFLKQHPTHAEGLLMRGIVHMQREQYREAEISFTTALNQGADRKKCLMGIGMASMGRAYPQGAWQTFLRVLAENPDDPEAIHWLLRAGTAQNRWHELSVQLRNYLARNPSDLAVRFAFAGVLLRAEQLESARQEYEQLRALSPSYDGLRELGQAIAGKEALLTMDVSNA